MSSQTSQQYSMNISKKDTNKDVYRYIDIDSTYRNRVNYPIASNFVIPINYAGRDSTAATSIDPIIDGIPYGLAGGVTQTSANVSSIMLGAGEISIDNYYINSILDISPNAGAQQFVKITGYNGTTKVVTLQSPLNSVPLPGTVYFIRKTAPFFVGTLTNATPITKNTFSLNTASSSIDNIYNNSFLRFLTGPNAGQVSRISSYTGSTRSVTLFTSLPNFPSNGDEIELLSYTRDNASTLLSSGSIQSNGQSSSYYELDLHWISLPNQTLNVGYGGVLPNYPYLYVQLYNEGKRESNQVLMSNNPNSVLAMFKVPVDDEHYDSSFLTLRSCRTKQTVRIDPDQDLRFCVTLPDGTPISYSLIDNFSPLAPNPSLQINALFSIKKV